jgi:4-diphosphocytidyl-2-C-methyl-D-erythritol kinase
MSGSSRQARVRALAKINLDLRVLAKRPDGYHELRTIFQTISLSDTIDIQFVPGRRTSIHLQSEPEIANNLVERAARLVMDCRGPKGDVVIGLTKKIPMGSGLGGGSSDAAAILLALPALTGRAIGIPALCNMAQQLGSDVGFFLLGGTAVGIGRGGELFPLPDGPVRHGVVVMPGVSVSTAEAYRRLSPQLTSQLQENKIFSFQSHAWEAGDPTGGPNRATVRATNDFEAVVFEQHRTIAVLKRRLSGAGARPALMTGSGSAVFGLFQDRNGVNQALQLLKGQPAFRISLVSRSRYRSMWWRALEEHIDGRVWPPQSRYLK